MHRGWSREREKRQPLGQCMAQVALVGQGMRSITAPNLPRHWTGSSRFSLVSIATALAAAPG